MSYEIKIVVLIRLGSFDFKLKIQDKNRQNEKRNTAIVMKIYQYILHKLFIRIDYINRQKYQVRMKDI